jgi:hypothetical protein
MSAKLNKNNKKEAKVQREPPHGSRQVHPQVGLRWKEVDQASASIGLQTPWRMLTLNSSPPSNNHLCISQCYKIKAGLKLFLKKIIIEGKLLIAVKSIVLTLIHTEIGMLLVQPVSSSCVKTHLVSKF